MRRAIGADVAFKFEGSAAHSPPAFLNPAYRRIMSRRPASPKEFDVLRDLVSLLEAGTFRKFRLLRRHSPAPPRKKLDVLRNLASLLGFGRGSRRRRDEAYRYEEMHVPDDPAATRADVRRFVAERVALLDCDLDTVLYSCDSYPHTIFESALGTAGFFGEFAEADEPLLTALVRRGVSLDGISFNRPLGRAGRAEDLLTTGWRATSSRAEKYAVIAVFLADERACRARWSPLRAAWTTAVVSWAPPAASVDLSRGKANEGLF